MISKRYDKLRDYFLFKKKRRGFPGGVVVKHLPANAGDKGPSPGPGGSHWRGATKPMCHNYQACTLEPGGHNYWAHVPQLLKPTRLEPMLCKKRSHRNKKPMHRSEE